ncbi:histidine ammonia-lyase [Hippea jasoniae]|uniref:histidine ammonia-lyase n=1 Tax=Hippea jasoniae TaxID=944479 RepID=UPI00068FFEBF|nr:histidine ammonia-lyase [Hippea jasoniae]
MKDRVFYFGQDRLSIADAIALIDGSLKGELSKQARKKILKSFNVVKNIAASDKAVYGVNTGFGVLCRTVIEPSKRQKLQYNLLKSHSFGVGSLVDKRIAKLMLILKVHSLSMGYSGVSLETIERIIWHINNDCIPIVPMKGSVGASGDLVPLAHLFLPLIGLGFVEFNGKKMEADKALKQAGLKPLILHPKEGLALINGTQFISSWAVWGLYRFKNLLEHADITAAITIEALKGSIRPFDERLHKLRPFKGNLYVAKKIYSLLEDSEIVRSHINCNKVQDPYSLRCVPQVHGACWDAFLHLKEKLLIEINSVTDNPVVFDEETVLSGGNFHGEPVGMAIDYASLAAVELGNIIDRRCNLLLAGDDELPKMLLEEVGINSGFMISEYVTAALASENKTMAFPATADTIPTSLGQEDHVSMASIAAVKFNRILDNLTDIVAIEFLLAFQGFGFRRPLVSTEPIEKVIAIISDVVEFAREDRIFSYDVEKLRKLIESSRIVKSIEGYYPNQLSQTFQL